MEEVQVEHLLQDLEAEVAARTRGGGPPSSAAPNRRGDALPRQRQRPPQNHPPAGGQQQRPPWSTPQVSHLDKVVAFRSHDGSESEDDDNLSAITLDRYFSNTALVDMLKGQVSAEEMAMAQSEATSKQGRHKQQVVESCSSTAEEPRSSAESSSRNKTSRPTRPPASQADLPRTRGRADDERPASAMRPRPAGHKEKRPHMPKPSHEAIEDMAQAWTPPSQLPCPAAIPLEDIKLNLKPRRRIHRTRSRQPRTSNDANNDSSRRGERSGPRPTASAKRSDATDVEKTPSSAPARSRTTNRPPSRSKRDNGNGSGRSPPSQEQHRPKPALRTMSAKLRMVGITPEQLDMLQNYGLDVTAHQRTAKAKGRQLGSPIKTGL